MAHIQHLVRKRHTVKFFGTECQIADMAHESFERQRVETENEMLRSEIAGLRSSLAEALYSLHAAAAKVAELMEREPALVAAIERAEASLRLAQEVIVSLQDEAAVLMAQAAQAGRTIESLSEIDSE